MLDIKGASKYLGMPEGTIRYWCFTKKIRHYKLGKRLKFDRADLDKFIESCLVEEGGNGRL
ncbi:MAG TPA: helix-turn-helix domain-containing protein [Candidatus Avalokitesvara rifleensis]|uniref:helix-turn-helix domain-containing protein n=1 Tax=Candidatus Avalokitesvara rifleensis TaxID=3367620 RepID=UPI002714226B|nr:helix-turn-helix domain-containing protein [Candidatus Brocadiales bacterium]